MEIVTHNLSSLHSVSLSSNLFGLDFKQIRRTYPGNYSLNFAFALSGYNDFDVKNYSNFYLTKKFKLSDIVELNEEEIIKSSNIYTSIKYGEDYLYFSPQNESYGTVLFGPASRFNIFNLSIFDNNRCHIYYQYNYKKYYLCSDINNDLYFVKDKFLDFSEDTINPQDFYYLYSDAYQEIYFFKQTLSGSYFFTDQLNKGILLPILSNDVVSIMTQPLKINKKIYYDPKQTLNTSFITYNDINQIDIDKSLFNLTNNFLLHKKYSEKVSPIDILVLKNQLLDNDVYSSSNVLISSTDIKIYADSFREYTSIFKDIKEESTNEIELNYTFYNKSYPIYAGSNTFVSPSSMYPFQKININDLKFVESGSFGYPTPEFADKIYRVSTEPQNKKDNQHLLCTWLSGSPFSTEKVWVDRYYYPDLIKKEEALASKSYFYPTYDNYIEQLIQNNSTLKNQVIKNKIFDKKSDMVFEPNQTYVYERLIQNNADSLQNTNYTYCDTVYPTINYPAAYYNEINESSKITLSFFFNGDFSTWNVFSDRDAVDGGLTVQKFGTLLVITYNLFDSSTQTYKSFSVQGDIIPYKENFFCFSFDTLLGHGYFFLNNKILLQFDVAQYQYTIKNIIYGDFYINIDNKKIDLLQYKNEIYNTIISDKYTPEELAFALSIVNSKDKIDTIYITLPQGMRNGFDNIQYLQNVCESSTFKSNSVNIVVKNTNIDNFNVLKAIQDNILNNIKGFMPSNTRINNITFVNYK